MGDEREDIEDIETEASASGGFFIGDLDRNGVELKVDKFVELLNENFELKSKIKDIEESKNPWSKWVHLARTFDAWRVWPRAFLIIYMILLYKTVDWFMYLENPTMAQSSLISVIVGAGAAWFGLYTTSRGDGPPKKKYTIYSDDDDDE